MNNYLPALRTGAGASEWTAPAASFISKEPSPRFGTTHDTAVSLDGSARLGTAWMSPVALHAMRQGEYPPRTFTVGPSESAVHSCCSADTASTRHTFGGQLPNQNEDIHAQHTSHGIQSVDREQHQHVEASTSAKPSSEPAPWRWRVPSSSSPSLAAVAECPPRSGSPSLPGGHSLNGKGGWAWQSIPDTSVQPCSGRTRSPAGHTMDNVPGRRRPRIEAIEAFMMQGCAKHVEEPQRNANIRKAVDELVAAYPSLHSVGVLLNRYLKEVRDSMMHARTHHEEALREQQGVLYRKFESFFEDKICAILREKNKTEATSQRLHEEVINLRRDRDEELTQVKQDLMQKLNECERKEDEFRSFRKLIASVFKTNEKLTNRIEDLESVLRHHRIDIPPAPQDLHVFRSKREDGAVEKRDEFDIRRISEQVPIAFMEAARQEMEKSRLTLQKELLNCAFDDRSAYRLQVNSLKMENTDMAYRISTLEGTITELNRYIYEQRFERDAHPEDGEVPLTPRPRHIPFCIQTELNIDLKASTCNIVSELSSVAINLKHQLNSALMRVRQMTSVSQWIQEESLMELIEERNPQRVLPVYPTNMWSSIPHFLRTRIETDVQNLQWTEMEVGTIFLNFFLKFKQLRESCRYLRDTKMVAPRHFQLFERREFVLTRLDATKEEVIESELNVPFGYVVSHFIESTLIQLDEGCKTASLLLPGTLKTTFISRGNEKAISLEFTQFAYSMWWAAQAYKATQPMCRLFLDIVDGRLPIDVFDVMQRSLQFVVACMERLDTDGSHVLTYPKLVRGILRILSDLDAQAARCSLLAVAQTFEANDVPIVGGRIRMEALLADELLCERQPDPRATKRMAPSNNLPSGITRRCLPSRVTQPLGASVFVRYWRRLIIQRYERVYNLVEQVLAPLVEESQIVLGLYLLPVPEALERARRFDAEPRLKAEEFIAGQSPQFPEDSAIPLSPLHSASRRKAADRPQSASQQATAEVYHNGMPRLTNNYATLLAERRALVTAQQASQNVMLERLISDILHEQPRLSRSVHFPFHTDVSASGTGVDPSASQTTEATTKHSETTESGAGISVPPQVPVQAASVKLTKLTRRKGRTTEGHPSVPAIQSGPGAATSKRTAGKKKRALKEEGMVVEIPFSQDKEVVEWYGFCFALRQQVLPFTEKLFSSDGMVEEPDHMSDPGIPGEQIPVLTTQEEEPPQTA